MHENVEYLKMHTNCKMLKDFCLEYAAKIKTCYQPRFYIKRLENKEGVPYSNAELFTVP